MITLFTGALGLCIAALILWLMRRDHLHVDHGVGWLLVAAGFALLGFAPSIIDHIASRVGIGYPPVLGLSLAIGVLVIKLLLMDIERSRIEVRNRRLTQRLGMLELAVRELQRTAREPGARLDEQRGAPEIGTDADPTVEKNEA